MPSSTSPNEVPYPGIKGFVAQASPMEPKNKPEDAPKEQYNSLKAQCTYLLSDAVNKHRMALKLDRVELPGDMTLAQLKEMLVADLEQMKRKDADKDGKLKIVGKDEVKDHLGRSPDFGDTLMMRMWFELKPPCQASYRRRPRAWFSRITPLSACDRIANPHFFALFPLF